MTGSGPTTAGRGARADRRRRGRDRVGDPRRHQDRSERERAQAGRDDGGEDQEATPDPRPTRPNGRHAMCTVPRVRSRVPSHGCLTSVLTLSAPALLREVGLLADGPLPWGRPVPGRSPGVFLVELAGTAADGPDRADPDRQVARAGARAADGRGPADVACAGRAARRRSGCRRRPSSTSGRPRRRSADDWRRWSGPCSATAGRSRAGTGCTRCAPCHPPGCGGPPTAAVEEYEDALLTAFAAAVPEAERAALPDREIVLPFANLRRPTGERKAEWPARLAAARAGGTCPPPDPHRGRSRRRRRGGPRRTARAEASGAQDDLVPVADVVTGRRRWLDPRPVRAGRRPSRPRRPPAVRRRP